VSRKKREREVCLLFWLKICSIISAYFRPILVLKFQLKSSVKTSAKTRGFLSLFFIFFLLYSRALLGFSLSPILLLCAFHCFNCWKYLNIFLLKLYWFSFHFIVLVFGYCLSLCFLVCELPYKELERRISAINWRIWVKKQGANHLKSYWTKKHSKLSETPKREQPPKSRTFL